MWINIYDDVIVGKIYRIIISHIKGSNPEIQFHLKEIKNNKNPKISANNSVLLYFVIISKNVSKNVLKYNIPLLC